MNQGRNYYQLLGIDSQATAKQIRSAFRQRAKQVHPDITAAGVVKSGERQMHLLIKAYHILSHPDLRRDYDLTHGIDTHKFNFDFREMLKQRTGDLKSLARLIFHDLLHDRRDEAISIFEQYFGDELEASMSRRSMRKHLAFYFTYSDYMDCLFLLAEAYEGRHQYLQAMRFYRNIARLESYRVTFGSFFLEVREAMRRIVRLWEKNTHLQHVVRFVPTLLDIRALKKDRDFYKKKILQYQHLYHADHSGRESLRQTVASMMRPKSAVREKHA